MKYRNPTKLNADESVDCEVLIGSDWNPHTMPRGKTEQRDTGEIDDKDEPILETVDVYQELIDSGVEIEAYIEPEPTPHELKLAGVEFGAVMCSATAEDQHGLTDIKQFIVEYNQSIPFHFENGNVLLLTPDNLTSFQAVWVPFRLSFFA